MISKPQNGSLWILIILIAAFLIRLQNLSFPIFTSDEARVAHRGYTLAATGKDELGRTLPLIFNSLEDYRLPVVSYLVAVGVSVFGKTDLGVRIPFILIGTSLVLLVFLIAKSFSSNFYFRFASAFIVASSPALIFLSKIPNEAIVLTFLFASLFYLIISSKNIWMIVSVMLLAALTSKLSWFILLPFLLFTIWWFGLNIKSKKSLYLLLAGLVITACTVTIFLTIPQSQRSLIENNFPIFSDSTIRNGIDTLRGQGMEAGWPNFLDRLLFNKSHFLSVGFLNWFSHLDPAIYFGQFDESGGVNFSSLGAWEKILIVPFFLGLIVSLQKGERKIKMLIPFFLLITYPALFTYPNFVFELIAVILPFLGIIISYGFFEIYRFSKKIAILGILIVIFELILTVYNPYPEYKITNLTRPSWMQNILVDTFRISKDTRKAISDDIVIDITPFLNWYLPLESTSFNLNDLKYPYKFRQAKVADTAIIGFDNTFYNCGFDKPTYILASKRDLAKVRRWLNLTYEKAVEKKYLDNLNNDIAYLLNPTICVK